MASDRLHDRAWQSPADTAALRQLVRARLDVDWPSVRMHPGDIDWWVVQASGRDPGLQHRVRLWFDQRDALVAFAWLSPPADLDMALAPRSDLPVMSLVGDIVGWGERQQGTVGMGTHEALRAWVPTADAGVLGALDALGMVPEPRPGLVQFTGDLAVADAWPSPALPPGLRILELTDGPALEARVACGRAAFSRSTMTRERYRTVFDAPLYDRRLDLQIATPDGSTVAFALGWLDRPTGVVELEPVGVHPDWHRRGLGGEICRAVLRVARDLGARRAMITAERANDAALALYASLGLTTTSEIMPLVRHRGGAAPAT